MRAPAGGIREGATPELPGAFPMRNVWRVGSGLREAATPGRQAGSRSARLARRRGVVGAGAGGVVWREAAGSRGTRRRRRLEHDADGWRGAEHPGGRLAARARPVERSGTRGGGRWSEPAERSAGRARAGGVRGGTCDR